MSSKYMWLIIVVLAVLAGGYLLMKGQSSSPSQTEMTNPTQVSQQGVMSPTSAQETGQVKEKAASVEYTPNGFVPKSITVKVGTTVTWTNKDTDDVWVASAPHPQHTDLPGFDALKGYKTGESYSYTFTKAGNWKYHNHLDPKNFGAVVVEQ